MAEKNMNAKISVEFEETATRQQLSSGDNLPTLFGKIKKFFTDLKPVALSGSYNDLDDILIAGEGIKINDANEISAVGISTEGITKEYSITDENGETTKTEVTGAKGDCIFNNNLNIAASLDGSATAFGYQTVAAKKEAFAEGGYTKALGQASHAEGRNTIASGPSSHAEGAGSKADASGAHAEGENCQALNAGAHAEGNLTVASGFYSHSEGVATKALGQSSHAEGSNSVGEGPFSHAEGQGSYAASFAQHAQGRYNIIDKEMKYAHIVGNGQNEDILDEEGNIVTQNRSNAHTLDWLGNAWFAGTIKGKNFDSECISNTNLLINPDFSINQRGKTEYTGSGYAVDGWFISANSTYNATAKVLAANATATTEVYIEQKIENPSDFRGKEITFSANLSSSVPAALKIYAYNGSEYTVAKSDEVYEGFVACTLTIPDDTTSLFVRVISYGVGETKAEQVKLELGSIQTLARQDDDGNWVIIDPPPNPALELAKCQRYLLPLPFNFRYAASRYSINDFDFVIPTPVPMRTLPTLDLSTAKLTMWENGTAKVITEGFTITASAVSNVGIMIRASKSAHGYTGLVYLDVSTVDAVIYASAEL